MKLLVGIILFNFLAFVNANECSSQLFKQKEEISLAFRVEATLENHFTYITSISGFRKIAFQDGAINMVNKIDQDLYLRIVEVIHYSKNESKSSQIDANSAIDAFIKDTEYYPLTWSLEDKEVLEEFRSSIGKNDV
jgi:hypothetical protein